MADAVFKCSFCGKSKKQVKELIAGPGVFICDECVDTCWGIINEQQPATWAGWARSSPTMASGWSDPAAELVAVRAALQTLIAATKPVCQWWTLERPLTSEDYDALADAFNNACAAMSTEP